MRIKTALTATMPRSNGALHCPIDCDVFNTVTSIFYFVLLFASSMFYPVDPLPTPLRQLSWANPITWHVDVLRYATIGLGDPSRIWLESAAFVIFAGVSFLGALWALQRQ